MIERLYERLRTGETVPVRVPETGKAFSIRPEYFGNFIFGYTVVECGRAVRGRRGMQMSREEVEWWATQLEECSPQEE